MSYPERDVLCVIDMQYPFVSADDNAEQIDAVVALCREAVSRDELILIIEDTHGHPTADAIKEAVRGYSNVHYLSKSQWDGSLQVSIKCTELKVAPKRVAACGAYDSQCVRATINGMREWFPATPIIVHRNACVPAPTTGMRPNDWANMARRLNVAVC